ncbi:MAG: hypothetical protein JW832_09190 [Deltaproteobacteria bacterium]|nr:hypothetical protein [Deltaproteobacteria bacterium]
MNIFYDKERLGDIDQAISLFDAETFKSPTRSTIPLLSWVKHEQLMVTTLLEELGLPTGCSLYFEYQVKPPKGSGRASHTDLMAMSGAHTLAIEAKWTEPRYETVGEWLVKTAGKQDDPPANGNRRNVLDGWLSLLQQYALRSLKPDDFIDAVYQMVHRAASACSAGSKPKLAYLIFKPSDDPRTASAQTIRDDLAHLWGLLGRPSEFPFYLVEIFLTPTAAFNKIAHLPKNEETTSELVKQALLSDRLFNFARYSIKKIPN